MVAVVTRKLLVMAWVLRLAPALANRHLGGGGAKADRGATEGQNDDVAHGQGEDPHVDAEGQTHEV
jgi:hypothetical protein